MSISNIAGSNFGLNLSTPLGKIKTVRVNFMIWDSSFKYSSYFAVVPLTVSAGSPGGATNKYTSLAIGLTYA